MFLSAGVRRTILASLATAFLAACAPSAARDAATRPDSTAASSIEIKDDAGFTVKLAKPAERVIALVPSAMETLIAIGAIKQIVGRTRYDTAPEVADVPSVGGGVDPSVEAVLNLRPDLVISWESDKRQQLRERLLALGVPVFILRTEDTTDIFHGITSIGRLTGHDSSAAAVSASIRATLDSVHRSVSNRPAPSVLYVAYPEPPLTAGPKTFIGQLIALAGGRSIFADATQNWPNISMEEVVRRDPDLLIVPVGELKTNWLARFRAMQGWRDLRAVRNGKVVVVPADLMSRPSPSIAEASRVLRRAIHPEVVDSVSQPAGKAR